jgi:hypothetical protein
MANVLNIKVPDSKVEWLRLDGDYVPGFYDRVKGFVPKKSRVYVAKERYWLVDQIYFSRIFEMAYEHFDSIFLEERGKVEQYTPHPKQLVERPKNPESRLIYKPDGTIIAQFSAASENFVYWLNQKVDRSRWVKTEKTGWCEVEVNDNEALYFEGISMAQWGAYRFEIINTATGKEHVS